MRFHHVVLLTAALISSSGCSAILRHLDLDGRLAAYTGRSITSAIETNGPPSRVMTVDKRVYYTWSLSGTAHFDAPVTAYTQGDTTTFSGGARDIPMSCAWTLWTDENDPIVKGYSYRGCPFGDGGPEEPRDDS